MQTFQVAWISKASAAQRAGRAGRVGPGHCYRLYSSAVYEEYLDDHTTPEILRMPIDAMVLQMKSMNIDSVVNFPFPTPPDREGLRRAEQILSHLGALQSAPPRNTNGPATLHITDLGRAMSLFPLPPRFSKMLVAGQQHGCLPYVIAVVCALSVGDPFLREDAVGMDDDELDGKAEPVLSAAEIQHIQNPEVKAKEVRKLKRKAFFQAQKRHSALGAGASDVFRFLSAVGAYEFEMGSLQFCEKNYLRVKAMQEIHQLRAQISAIVQTNYPEADAGFVPKLAPPNDLQVRTRISSSTYADDKLPAEGHSSADDSVFHRSSRSPQECHRAFQ